MVKRIYCGSEDYADFFEKIVQILNLDIKYEVEIVDGEYELVIGEEE